MTANSNVAPLANIPSGPPAAGVPEVDSVRLFGIDFSNLSYEELCRFVDQRIAAREPGYVFTPNVDHAVKFERCSDFREAYRGAMLRLVDGTVLMWACHWLGKPVKEKLSGSDIVPAFSEYAAEKGYSIFLFGAAPGIAGKAAETLRGRFPGLNVVGTYCPPMGFEEDEAENAKAIEAVRMASPDFLFVALGSPRQEIWIAQHSGELGVPVTMGIGATLDFIAGRVKRAPRWMQRAGLEWVWRLLQEPRRLWKRYLIEDSAFLGMFIREWRRHKTTSNR